MPLRAMRTLIPRRRTHCQSSAWSLALSACSLSGLRRRGPQRDRIAGIVCTQWLECVGVVGVRGRDTDTRGSPLPSDRTWIFEPGLPRSTGSTRSVIPPFRPHGCGVDDDARPVDQPLATQLVQYRVMELAPQPGLGPLAEAAVRGLERHPERGRQIPPRTPAGQHVHDRSEHRTSRQRRRPTALRTRPELRTNGSTNDHNSSGTNRNDNRSTTSQDHVQRIIKST
jgi:hypothetical protein